MTHFHNTRFPVDISYGSSGGPEFATTILTLASGYEQRNINWSQARARYNVAYGVRTDAQLETLLSFFRARQGRAYGFRYKDWTDYRTASSGTPITATDQQIALGDGVTVSFPLIKTYTSGTQSYARRIYTPVAGSVLVALAATPVATGWSVNDTTGILTFTTPPAQGVSITAGFEFDVPARFDTDTLSISLDSYGIGSVQDVPVVEIRL
jgi:uncharacterized protein (TIGR02217 family)